MLLNILLKMIQAVIKMYIYTFIFIYIRAETIPQITRVTRIQKIIEANYVPRRIVLSSHLYLYSAFNNTNCNKALHNIKIGKLCQ